jgi:serine/threonine-protein kinase RsbW
MSSAPSYSFAVDGTLSGLTQASRLLREALAALGVDKQTVYALETALEEIVTNSIKYSFTLAEPQQIHVEVQADDIKTELRIEDNGQEFDPTLVPEPETNRPLERMPVGGLGIHMIRELTDGLEYHRQGALNIIRIWVDRKK